MSTLEKIQSLFTGPPRWSQAQGLQSASAAFVMARLFPRLKRTLLAIAPTGSEAEGLRNDLRFFLGEKAPLHFFPNLDVLPYFQLSPHPDVLTERLGTLSEIASARSPVLIVTSSSALLRRLPPRSIFNTYTDYVVSKEEIDREALLRKLVEAGYGSVPLVEDSGSFSVRGGIIDIFPPHSTHPYRIELFGDRVESIRLFEPSTQRSLSEVEDLVLLPAREIVLNEKTIAFASSKIRERFDELGVPKPERDEILVPLKNRLPFPGLETFLPFFYESTATLFDYLRPESLLFFLDPVSAREHGKKLAEDLQEAHVQATSPERVVSPPEIFLSFEQLEKERSRFGGLELGSILKAEGPSEELEPGLSYPAPEAIQISVETNELIRTKILPPSAGAQMLQPLVDYLKDQIREGVRVVLVAGSEAQRLRIRDLFERHDLKVQEFSVPVLSYFEGRGDRQEPVYRPVAPTVGGPFLTLGHLSRGFLLREERLHFITDEEIFGSKVRRARKAPPPSETFSAFEDLKEGDYVVHTEHGVGLYKGLKKLKLGEVEGEFLLLEYLGGDKLYLPVYRLNLIQRYTGESGYAPTLDKLGGTQWAKAQEKVKKAIRAMAGELLKIYAVRAAQMRKPYGGGGEVFEEFEASFPYEETPDQDRAIGEVVRDLESEKPMDRLVCGDVGFGKTEVALRAAFKAVLDGRQVAVLVPTTVLAFQHFQNFSARLKPFGVQVEMLSRFKSAQEQKEIIKTLNLGGIDVVIGTHRLLQSDLQFKNLGLLVIDEEHRFGVAHKEKIKKFKNLIDVLTLTATPIPRTLNISLFGIRDLSVINTPPPDRMAVRTYVAHFDEALVRDAILRELQRGGQVFFVHNRVQTIHAMAERLTALVPEAAITVAHGQMEGHQLEEDMMKFLQKKANVLLSTAIIESGLDFPSANTILINRADTFGLAQLYQLRGRVGRSNIRAYCYLLTPSEVAITKEARSRLAVLQRFTELGSGFKVAAHDLEIRGAGNLLGPEQHGHIEAIGYEMYMRLLEQTIAEIRGEEKKLEVDPELNFMIPAVLPEDYVPDSAVRLGLYKRIAHATDEEALDHLSGELQDRFGKPPPPALHLLMLMRIRIAAKRLLLESIHQERTRMIYKFHLKTPVPPDSLLNRMKKDPKNYKFTPDYQWITPQKEILDEKILESVYQFLVVLEGEIPQESGTVA